MHNPLPSLIYSQKGSVTAPALPQYTVASEEGSRGTPSLLKDENVQRYYKLLELLWHLCAQNEILSAHTGHRVSPSCAVNMWWDVKRSKASKQYTSSFKASL